ALQNNSAAETEMIALQKQNHFESFAIKRSESEQNQSREQRSLRDAMTVFNQRFAAAIVRTDPAAPINFVEKPIHDHEQHHDREQSSRGLQVERAHVVTQ